MQTGSINFFEQCVLPQSECDGSCSNALRDALVIVGFHRDWMISSTSEDEPDSGFSSLRSSPITSPPTPTYSQLVPRGVDFLNHPMEHVVGFSSVFSKVQTPVPWVLFHLQDPSDIPHLMSKGYKNVFETAKVRYICSICKNGWTSMRGKVTFFLKEGRTVTETGIYGGHVYYSPFGQRCGHCQLKGKIAENYEQPLWYMEEISKVVANMLGWMRFHFYGADKPRRTTVRRSGKPSQPHVSETCQACSLNLCREGAWRQLQ